MASKSGGSSRKIGRDTAKCAGYRARGQRDVNARRRLAKHALSHPADTQAAVFEPGLSKAETVSRMSAFGAAQERNRIGRAAVAAVRREAAAELQRKFDERKQAREARKQARKVQHANQA